MRLAGEKALTRVFASRSDTSRFAGVMVRETGRDDGRRVPAFARASDASCAGRFSWPGTHCTVTR